MHAGFGERSTISAIDAVSPIPATCICSSFLPPDRGSGCMLPGRSTPLNTWKHVWRPRGKLRQSEHAGATRSEITLPLSQAILASARCPSQPR